MPKQDRVPTRTAAGLEQKLRFGKRFAEVMGIATDAQQTAAETAEDLAEKLTPEEIFNLLTNNGEAQGLYRDEDGQLYFNGEFIQVETLSADRVRLTPASRKYSYYFAGWDELNAFVESEAVKLPANTQKTIGAVILGEGYGSYGIITMSSGLDSDLLPNYYVELSLAGERFYREAVTDNDDGVHTVIWDNLHNSEYLVGGAWSPVGVAKEYVDERTVGYGLGTVRPSKIVSLSELDSLYETGSYWLIAVGTTLNGVYFNYAAVYVHGMEEGACVQEIRPLAQNCVLTRYAYNGTFQPWECPNPPMNLGVEYRTTKRHNGKPVYTKAIRHTLTADTGSSTAATNFAINGSATNVDYVDIVSLVFCGASNGYKHPVPVMGASGNIYLCVNAIVKNNLYTVIIVNKDVLGAGSYFDIVYEYTKTTD